jgi:hypothetical protein
MDELKAYENPDHPGNGPEHHTGKPCIEKGCTNPAGTAWSPHWCFPCNVARIKRVSGQMEKLATSMAARKE